MASFFLISSFSRDSFSRHSCTKMYGKLFCCVNYTHFNGSIAWNQFIYFTVEDTEKQKNKASVAWNLFFVIFFCICLFYFVVSISFVTLFGVCTRMWDSMSFEFPCKCTIFNTRHSDVIECIKWRQKQMRKQRRLNSKRENECKVDHVESKIIVSNWKKRAREREKVGNWTYENVCTKQIGNICS